MWRSLRQSIQLHLKTVVAFGVVGGLAFAWSLYISSAFPGYLFNSLDFWYGSDTKHVAETMWMLESERFDRLDSHPLFSLIVLPPIRFLALYYLNGDVLFAIKLILAFFAAISAAFVYALARALLRKILFALLTTAFMLTSATFIFWSAVPETFLFGSAAISATFFFAIVGNSSPRIHVLLHVFSLAFTITNWLAAILASLSRFKLSSAVMVFLAGAIIASVLAIWQQGFLPGAPVFFLHMGPEDIKREGAFMALPSLENIPLYVARVSNYFFATVIAPEPAYNGKGVYSSLNYSPVGWIGIASWLVIFGAGVVRAFFISSRRRFLIVVGGFTVYQLALHLVYGDEPFLYSMHFLPALILIGCLSLTGKYRNYFAALMCISIICNLVNNVTRFLEAIALMPTT